MFKFFNDRRHIRFSFILCLFLLFFLSGCESKQKTDESNGNQVVLTPTVQPELDTSELIEDPNIEDFFEIEESFIDYTFDLSYDENLILYKQVYTIHGEYDLDGDGKAENINAVLKHDNPDGAYIEVNGMSLPIDRCRPNGEIKILDLDKRDSFVELAIVDDGLDGPANYILFRYDGKELSSLNSIEQYSLMDGQGKFIDWFHKSNNLSPQFYSAWGEFESHKIINHDVNQYIGKTYEVDGDGYFTPSDEYHENYWDYIAWDSEDMREFKKTKVKILGIPVTSDDRTLSCYYVELQDGKKGFLYFWIGP